MDEYERCKVIRSKITYIKAYLGLHSIAAVHPGYTYLTLNLNGREHMLNYKGIGIYFWNGYPVRTTTVLNRGTLVWHKRITSVLLEAANPASYGL